MTDLLNRTPPPRPATPSPGPSRHRAVWLVPGILLTAIGLLVVFQVIRGLLGASWSVTAATERQTYAEPVSRIEIYTDNGNIELAAGSGQDVVVERRSSISSGTPSYDEGVTGDTLRLDARCPSSNWFLIGSSCEVDYIVQVPAGVDIAARTDAGDLVVRDLDGDLDLNSDAGDIELSGISGDLLAYTDAGNVEGTDLSSSTVDVTSDAGDLNLGFGRAPQTVTAQTDAGDIAIILPDQRAVDGDPISYSVDAFTDAGSADVEVAQDGQSDRRITALTDAGEIRIGYRGGTPSN